MSQAKSAASARADLAFLDQLLARTREHVDPHAFHYVHWGWIVLVWYPLGNALTLAGRPALLVPLGIVALVTGMALSFVREARLARAPRLAGEDPSLGRNVARFTLAGIVAGMVLSFVAPATGLVRGENVPILWGLVYASIAFHTGVLYRRSFMWAGVCIFGGVVIACLLQRYNGIVLGPFMGLGMIVPGMMAERRVRRLSGEAGEHAPA